MNIGQIITRNAARHPKHIAYRFPDKGISVTTAELAEQSARWAGYLTGRGIRAGQVIGICMGNTPDCLYLIAAAARIGATVCLLSVINPGQSPCSILFTDSRNPHCPSLPGSIDISTEIPPESIAAFPDYDWKDEEALVIVSTSGTTGQRKWARKNAASVISPECLNPMFSVIFRIIPNYFYSVFPWYHTAGLTFLYASMVCCHLTTICTESFNPEQTAGYLNLTKPFCWYGTATMLYRVCKASSVPVYVPMLVMVTGESLPFSSAELFEAQENCKLIMSIYGSTELGKVSQILYRTNNPASVFLEFLLRLALISNVLSHLFTLKSLPKKPGFSGILDSKVRIVNEYGQELADGQIGEILALTKTAMLGYDDQYISTGDLGYRIGNQLYVVGRKNGTVNRSGEKILPSDMETRLQHLAWIEDLAVFGIPSPAYGEDICLCVQTENAPEDADRQILEALPKFMQPQFIHYLRRLPINATGKKDLMQLKQQFGCPDPAKGESPS